MSPAVEQDPQTLIWRKLEEDEQRIARLERTRGKSGGFPPESTKTIFKLGGTGGDSSGFYQPREILSAGEYTAHDLRHAITPALNLWWQVEWWCLFRILDAAWYELDMQWWLDYGAQTSDVLGQTRSPYYRVQNHSGTSPWVSGRCVGLFKLEKGKSYVVRPVAVPGRGTWVYYTNQAWLGSSSRIAGYW